MIDFEIPEEHKQLGLRYREFVETYCVPAEAQLRSRPVKEILKELHAQAKADGLWCPHMPKEWGGLGLGPLAMAIVQYELGGSPLGDLAVNTQGSDDATMLTIARYGTEAQKKKYLVPLVNGDARVCYSMTERAAGGDATGLQTTAVRDGENWILNGEKWFTSLANIADFAVVLAKTNPDNPRHEQFSAFLVDLPNPAYEVVRNVPVMGHDEKHYEEFGGHCEIRIDNLVLPADAILGKPGQGFALGQHRLGYGRLRHGMRNIGLAQKAMDLAVEHAMQRVTFGQPVADRQGIQFMLAECAEEIYQARLMVLHLAYKMENGLELRQENSIAKVFLPRMIHKVVDTALQLHGALGYTHDTPIARWYTGIRAQRLVDGPDEVHKWRVGRNVVKAFEKHGTTASACGGDLFY